jgi:HSP20 family protein
MDVDRIQAEMSGLLREPMPGQRWVSTGRSKTWRPATDVYETDTCIVVKVEIAGMSGDDLSISLDSRRLVISGTRHDPSSKLGYQQMEILYGPFETSVHLPRAIEEESVEASYQNGFLSVFLPKAKPHRVPVTGIDDPASS